MLEQNLQVPAIVIDGPFYRHAFGVGMAVAQSLGFKHADASLPYRAMALLIQRYDVFSDKGWAKLASTLRITIGESGQALVNGEDWTKELYDPRVDPVIRLFEQIPVIREALTPVFLSWRFSPGVVIWGGRDVGQWFDTPDRFFVDVGVTDIAFDVFSERRSQDRATTQEIMSLARRFRRKEEFRCVSPLTPCPGAIVIDTSDLLRDQVTEIIIGHYKNGHKDH